MPRYCMRPVRSLSQLLVSAAVALTIAMTGAPSADAAVQYRSCSQDNGTAVALVLFLGTNFSMAAPPGVQTGDVILLTIEQSQPWGIIFSWFNTPEGQARAWTPLETSGNTRSYFRVRQSSDPSSYTLYSPLIGVAASVSVSATMTAFSGADASDPIRAGATQSTASGLGTHALPSAPVVRQGSMRYSGVTTDTNSSFAYQAGLSGACTNQTSNRSASGAYEAVTPLTMPSRDVTIGGSSGPSIVAQTYVVQPPMPPCAPGSLSLTSQPSAVTFPAVTLDGTDQTKAAIAGLQVNDQTESHLGWRISATSTQFSAGAGKTLPLDATRVTGSSASAASGNCSLPTNSVTYPMTLPAGVVAPTAQTVTNATNDTGTGPTNVDLAMSLAVPGNTLAGTYTSTWTFTLTAAP